MHCISSMIQAFFLHRGYLLATGRGVFQTCCQSCVLHKWFVYHPDIMNSSQLWYSTPDYFGYSSSRRRLPELWGVTSASTVCLHCHLWWGSLKSLKMMDTSDKLTISLKRLVSEDFGLAVRNMLNTSLRDSQESLVQKRGAESVRWVC